MHEIQQKLLNLAANQNLAEMSFRSIGKQLGGVHPQSVKYHLEQLTERGLIQTDKKTGSVALTQKQNDIVRVPIVGSANCGDATIFANERVEGYLHASKKLLGRDEGVFAIRAVGSSMNQATIRGNSVDEGDFVLFDSKGTDPKNGDYVLTTVEGVANIKRFYRQKDQVVLMSESSEDHPPIFFTKDEINSMTINGTAIAVLKLPKI